MKFSKPPDSDCQNTIHGERVAAALSASSSKRLNVVRLREQHPKAFEEAKAYEKDAVAHGSPFTWSQGESLEELEQPERIAQIRADHEERPGPYEIQGST